MTEQELGRMIRRAYEDWNGGEAVAAWAEPVARRLLAAGVTLPPEPPALVTEEMVRGLWDVHRPNSWAKFDDYGSATRAALMGLIAALVAAAIRRAVERRTEDGQVAVPESGEWYYHSPKAILALFNLPEAS